MHEADEQVAVLEDEKRQRENEPDAIKDLIRAAGPSPEESRMVQDLQARNRQLCSRIGKAAGEGAGGGDGGHGGADAVTAAADREHAHRLRETPPDPPGWLIAHRRVKCCILSSILSLPSTASPILLSAIRPSDHFARPCQPPSSGAYCPCVVGWRRLRLVGWRCVRALVGGV
eukprot:2433425-Rhodomonas_salina.1